ncbi:hypothetical protein [Rufibacter tibetensis]|uniref:Uncharacterized protein n=1 Tax=Rufibacter tibetensis TaxID=512763 RepID=A0A0P0C4Q9_9BACT|nr:hypothetical protein [Rufibacter tibetensis]ALJ00150.1 hypothetical protein DC20_15720 [Rufibacter tibetensis]
MPRYTSSTVDNDALEPEINGSAVNRIGEQEYFPEKVEKSVGVNRRRGIQKDKFLFKTPSLRVEANFAKTPFRTTKENEAGDDISKKYHGKLGAAAAAE